MIICTEGCIGVGKTTLTKKLAGELGGHGVFEEFENNPFLKDFYEEPDTFAFHVQCTFLCLQSKQFLKAAILEKQKNVFADFHPVKSRIFSDIVIKDAAGYAVIQKIYDQLFAPVKETILIVYLKAQAGVILERIRQRNDPFAAVISLAYIQSVIDTYELFFSNYSGPLVTIDTNTIDFENNDTHWQLVRQQITAAMNSLEK